MECLHARNRGRDLRRLPILLIGVALALSGCGGGGGSSDSGNAGSGSGGGAALTLADLGERIFQDTDLSNPPGQSCQTCHDPAVAFTDPANIDKNTPVSVGADLASVGSRNAPTAGYTRFIPAFTMAPPKGGQFIDGRDDSLEDQARRPFLNLLEMANPDIKSVVDKLRVADYADDFLRINGANAFDDDNFAYGAMVTAIAAFERTDVFSPFSSNFDAFPGTPLAADEERGRVLFFGPVAKCSGCHNTSPADGPQVFSDFRYWNIGVPANPNNPFLVPNPLFVDNGLGAVLADPNHNGKFRTPTLRNVAKTAPYMHNGVFDSLEEVMGFYNSTDRTPFPPEVNANLDPRVGNLGLSPTDIADIIAFMEALSDS